MAHTLIAIGNIYLETNYLGLETGGKNSLSVGHEYRSTEYETKLGGSVVNFICQAKKLGVSEIGLIGKIGEDEAGSKVITLLHQNGISTEYMTVSPHVQTGVDTGLVLKHIQDNIQLVSGNANQSLSETDIKPKIDSLSQVTAVYLGGFFKQESLYRSYPTLLNRLADAGVRIFLDHGRLPVNVSGEMMSVLYSIFPYIEGYFPNEAELLAITHEKDLSRALEKSLTMGPKFIAVKLGKSGCKVISRQGLISTDGINIKPVNVVGAGDSFNAGFIYRLLQGVDYSGCAVFANATAAFRVSRNYLPDKGEVEAFLDPKS